MLEKDHSRIFAVGIFATRRDELPKSEPANTMDSFGIRGEYR